MLNQITMRNASLIIESFQRLFIVLMDDTRPIFHLTQQSIGKRLFLFHQSKVLAHLSYHCFENVRIVCRKRSNISDLNISSDILYLTRGKFLYVVFLELRVLFGCQHTIKFFRSLNCHAAGRCYWNALKKSQWHILLISEKS